MSNDPSKPSGSDPANRPPAPGRASAPLRAVLTGVSIEICATTLLGFILGTIYAAQVTTPDMTPSQVDDAVRNIPPQSPLVALGILLSALVSVAAGYVCARIARRNEFATGAVMAACATLVSLALSDVDREPVDLIVLFVVTDIACRMLGVKYGAAQNRRIDSPADAAADTPTP